MRILAALSFLALIPAAVAQTTAVQAPDFSRLTPDHRASLRCAAAFAIVATEQAGGDALPGWPLLAVRGKRFFTDTGVAVMQEAGLDRAAVQGLIAVDVQALQTSADPDAALLALAKPCLIRLDATIAPLVTPSLNQCAAILALAYEEVYARDGLTPAARDLKTLASVLAAREREALIALGKTNGEADRVLAETREAIIAEAGQGTGAGTGGIEKYEIAHCYTLAKPDEKTHY